MDKRIDEARTATYVGKISVKNIKIQDMFIPNPKVYKNVIDFNNFSQSFTPPNYLS